MITSNDMTSLFNRTANVGNSVLVLLIVLVGIYKPSGAAMV